MAGGLALFASGAGAAPQPSVSQVQAKINQLTTQFDKVSEQLDQASQQLSAAQAKLGQVQVRLKNANTQFQTAQANMAATAAAAFEDTGATSVAGVLTSGDPAVLLQQGSLLMELSGNRSAQTKQLLTDASQLAGVEQEMSRTETGIAGLKRQLSDHKSSRADQLDRRGRHGHDLGHLQRDHLDPGREGRGLRLRPAGQAVPVGRDRTGQL
jgi:septal ring factor EnvC (AmiA/AmiB activator)